MRVEVFDPEVGGYFPAYVKKWTETTAHVVYDDNWREPQDVAFQYVRTTPPHEELHPDVSEKVDLLHVSYDGFDDSFNEWVETCRVRMANDKTVFEPSTLNRHDITLDPSFLKFASDESFMEEIRSLCGLVSVEVSADSTPPTWIVVGNQESIRKMRLIEDATINRMKIASEKERFLTEMQRRSQGHDSAEHATINIRREHVALAIGLKGAYISFVESIPDVYSVRIDRDDNSEFAKVTIIAKTKAALEIAIRHMTIISKKYPLKPEDIGIFIGRNGAAIRRLITESGVFRINIHDDGAEMIGSEESVETAFVLAETSLKLSREMQQSIDEIDAQMRAMLPNNRRYDLELPSFMRSRRDFSNRTSNGRGAKSSPKNVDIQQPKKTAKASVVTTSASVSSKQARAPPVGRPITDYTSQGSAKPSQQQPIPSINVKPTSVPEQGQVTQAKPQRQTQRRNKIQNKRAPTRDSQNQSTNQAVSTSEEAKVSSASPRKHIVMSSSGIVVSENLSGANPDYDSTDESSGLKRLPGKRQTRNNRKYNSNKKVVRKYPRYRDRSVVTVHQVTTPKDSQIVNVVIPKVTDFTPSNEVASESGVSSKGVTTSLGESTSGDGKISSDSSSIPVQGPTDSASVAVTDSTPIDAAPVNDSVEDKKGDSDYQDKGEPQESKPSE